MTRADLADFKILSLANEKRKFAVQLGQQLNEEEQLAFERGIDAQWFTLVDVSPVAEMLGVYRIFRLTDAGVERHRALVKMDIKRHAF